jgi:hypothetical protein
VSAAASGPVIRLRKCREKTVKSAADLIDISTVSPYNSNVKRQYRRAVKGLITPEPGLQEWRRGRRAVRKQGGTAVAEIVPDSPGGSGTFFPPEPPQNIPQGKTKP